MVQIAGLEKIIDYCNDNLLDGYVDTEWVKEVAQDALDQLKKQEARIRELEECHDASNIKAVKQNGNTKWEDIKKQYLETSVYRDREVTNIDCPKCGKKLYKRTDIVLTSYPPQYQYECECGFVGYAHV